MEARGWGRRRGEDGARVLEFLGGSWRLGWGWGGGERESEAGTGVVVVVLVVVVVGVMFA